MNNQQMEIFPLFNFPKLNDKLPLDTLFIEMPHSDQISFELRQATKFFSKYQMNNTSKWLSELLNSKTIIDNTLSEYQINCLKKNTRNDYPVMNNLNPKEEMSDKVKDHLLMIKSLYNLGEYKKCSFKAREILKDGPQHNELIFYQIYPIYLQDTIKKEEQFIEDGESGGENFQFSYELETSLGEMEKLMIEKKLNVVNKFVIALIYLQKQQQRQAVNLLFEILNENPFFWSAWLELQKQLNNQDQDSFEQIGKINNHWMKNFYSMTLLIENIRSHENYENYCYDICSGLFSFFKNSSYLLNVFSSLFYNISDYERSLNFFNRIMMLDPYRYENIDMLSNILYVKEKKNELGKLAIECFENDKYIPETCCVLGNYYSLIGQHKQAAEYFQRAIKLDRNFLAAYTLLGHEYLEIKNVTRAVQSYNNALKINTKDYRAWYGLGQAYELQGHFQFALYYFQQALKSNPRDSRMWNAISTCFDKNKKFQEAALCLEKAQTFKDHEGISLFQLGKLYDLMDMQKKAVECFERHLQEKEDKKIIDKELGEALLYLAIQYKNQQQYQKAIVYASKLLNFNGIEKQEAQNLIHELNSLINRDVQLKIQQTINFLTFYKQFYKNEQSEQRLIRLRQESPN